MSKSAQKLRPPKPPSSSEAKPLRGAIATKLLPQTRFGGPIPWVIAILIALVVVAAAGGLALRNLAENARADLSGALTVQIVDANPETRTAQTQAAVRVLSNTPMVTSVRAVPEEELTAMLEPWLGAGASSGDVPIPALIDVELDRRATAQEITRLQSNLEQTAPNARVDAQSEWLRPVYNALAALQYLALVLIALVAFATAAAVWLAARNALASQQETVEIMHLLGGTDAQVTGIFQRSMLRDAAFGGLVGLALGALAVWFLGQQFTALESGMVAGGGLRWIDWLILAAVPVFGIVLALITGRITIAIALKSML